VDKSFILGTGGAYMMHSDFDWSTTVPVTSVITGTAAVVPDVNDIKITFTQDVEPILIPKCCICNTEVEAVSTFVQGSCLTVILMCHGDERRIDIALTRFKGNKEDAILWFSNTFLWVFSDDVRWIKVQPPKDIKTIREDRKIIIDWLENL
jgi:hypothetical protein